MNSMPYPEAPAGISEKITAPSASFKQHVSKVIFSISLFFMVYILLVIAAFILAAACFYAGFYIIIFHPAFLTIILGLGVAAVGVSVIFFLIKFIFSVSKDDNPSRVEIKEEDQPQLFAFIRKLTAETHTPFPKKIYVSPDVNACVFYNSSFWSMFLPVRKNLEIGLGLVNSINISEFKAVMAHEFGHFSQRSMKLGSFTYNVNRVIYNMLYDNNGYNNFLNSWGRINGYLGIFVLITIKIATGIQWILRGMYTIINKNYLGLSREMEFHADGIAAAVAGGNNLVSGLGRAEVAQSCYSSAINKANEWLKQNKVSKNIFDNQLSVFRSLAKEYQLPLKEGLPEISYHFIQSFSSSRINYKNQWASHPTLEERKEQLDKLGVNSIADERNAWQIFNNPEKLQETLTANLYNAVELDSTPEIYDADYFEANRIKEKDKYTLPPAYKGFYDKRFINAADWDIETLSKTVSRQNFDGLFNEPNAQWYASISNNEHDLATVKAIKEKQVDVKSFDFDGTKYTVKDCDTIIAQIGDDIQQQTQQLERLDKEAFIFFCTRADEKRDTIKSIYLEYQQISKAYDGYIVIADNIIKTIQPFYQGGLSNEQVMSIIGDFKNSDETKLKAVLADVLKNNIITAGSNESLFNSVTNFLEKEYLYFISNEFQNNELNDLNNILVKLAEDWNDYRFSSYKKMLEQQLEYYT